MLTALLCGKHDAKFLNVTLRSPAPELSLGGFTNILFQRFYAAQII